MIWAGIALAVIGGTIFYRHVPFSGIPLYHAGIAVLLVLNGLFLSFSVSPFLLRREREGRQRELLPASLQRKILVSLILSDLGWWGGLALLARHLVERP